MRRRAALLVATLLLAPLLLAPAGFGRALEESDRWVAIRCGRLITGAGEEKENVVLLIKNGKVDRIGDKLELPFPCEMIDASSATVMPGHVALHSRLSLLEYPRQGMRADLKVADEFFPTGDAFDAALSAGFTALQLVPPGTSGVPGRCMVVRTADVGDGLALDDDGSVKVNLLTPAQDRRTLVDALNGAKKEIEKVEKARADFEAKKKAAEEARKKEEEAKKQQQGGTPQPPPQTPPQQPPQPQPQPQPPQPPKREEPPKPDTPKPGEAKPEEAKKEETFQPPPIAPQLQPFVDLIQKKEGALAYVRLGGASTFLHFVEATKEFEIAHVLQAEVTAARGRPQAFFGVSGTDLHWVAKQLGERKELVVLTPYLSYSQGSVDYVNVPKEMAKAGARVALTPANDSPDELAAFRFNVGELMKGGLARADAIAAITKHAAEAAGLGARLGTLEPGKDGSVVILTGDPFDVQSVVDRVVIEGRLAWSRSKKPRS